MTDHTDNLFKDEEARTTHAICGLLAWLTSPDYRGRLIDAGVRAYSEDGISGKELSELLGIPFHSLAMWLAHIQIADHGGEAIIRDKDDKIIARAGLNMGNLQ